MGTAAHQARRIKPLQGSLQISTSGVGLQVKGMNMLGIQADFDAI